MIENNMYFNGVILEKQSDGKVIEKTETVSADFIDQYQGKLAILDNEGKPYGEVDGLLIERNPNNLLVKKDEGKSSIEIMSGAIKETSSAGLNSLAISTDTLEEIESVRAEIVRLLQEDQQMQKIGFYYPEN